MKFNFKKLIAASTAAAAAISMCGCMDNGTIMTVDGMSINNGIYLYYQQSAYEDAQSLIDEIRAEQESDDSDDESSDTAETDYFTAEIDGVSASQWIKDETIRLVKQYVAVQRLCEEKGVELEQDIVDEISEYVNSTWDDENYYMYYFFGYYTAGEYYESLGIGRESYSLIYTASTLKDALFTSMYDTDGEKAVTDDELLDYLKENFLAAAIFELPYEDYEGNELTLDSEIAEIDALAEEYAQRLNNGESLINIQYAIDLRNEQESVRSDIEDYYDSDPIEGMTKEEYVEGELAALTVDMVEDEEELITYCSKDTTSVDEEILSFVLNADEDGTASVLKTEDSVYVIARYDITTREEWIEENRSSLLISFKGEEYEDYLDEYAAGLSVSVNSYLIDSKYKPENMKS